MASAGTKLQYGATMISTRNLINEQSRTEKVGCGFYISFYSRGLRCRVGHTLTQNPKKYGILRRTLLPQVVAERGLQAHPAWMNKCIQLYETYLVRHGIMLVGPSGSGKTTIMECLAAALTELGTKTVLWRMNPKVCLHTCDRNIFYLLDFLLEFSVLWGFGDTLTLNRSKNIFFFIIRGL